MNCDLNFCYERIVDIFIRFFSRFCLVVENKLNFRKMKDIEQCLKDDEAIVSSAAEFAKGTHQLYFVSF